MPTKLFEYRRQQDTHMVLDALREDYPEVKFDAVCDPRLGGFRWVIRARFPNGREALVQKTKIRRTYGGYTTLKESSDA